MPINDVFELAVVGTVASQQHIHTTHYRAMVDGATAGNLANAWQSFCQTQYRGCFSIDDSPVQLVRARAVCSSGLLPVGVENTHAPPQSTGTKTAGAEKEPSFLASSTRLRSDFAGRRYNGRYFLGGLQDNDVLLNNLSGTYITALQLYLTALLTRFGPSPTDTQFRLCIWSRTNKAEGLTCEQSSVLVTNGVVQTHPTTMRSRKLGHGI